jgi:hypothetical protein
MHSLWEIAIMTSILKRLYLIDSIEHWHVWHNKLIFVICRLFSAIQNCETTLINIFNLTSNTETLVSVHAFDRTVTWAVVHTNISLIFIDSTPQCYCYYSYWAVGPIVVPLGGTFSLLSERVRHTHTQQQQQQQHCCLQSE